MMLIKRIISNSYLLLVFAILAVSCSEDDDENVVVFEPYTFEATASNDTIQAGETVTFIDKSTNIYDRLWNFPGGDPSSSQDSIVTVTYENGGSFAAQLKVTYKDNSIKIQDFPIVVEGDEEEEEELVITGATYGVFTELEEVTPGVPIWYISAAGFQFIDNPFNYTGDPFEGEAAQSFTLDLGAGHTWAMVMIQGKEGVTADISEFANGYLNFAIKSTSTAPVKVRVRGGGGLDVSVDLGSDGEFGFSRDGSWHMLSIPMADLMATIPEADRAAALEKVADLFILRSVDGTDLSSLNNFDFDVDNVFYSVNKPAY